jgi:signal transduction histidine kinase
VSKSSELSPQLLSDVEKIINASLHAREVVKKLIIFARQMPTKKSKLNLNQIVEEGLYYFESRCAKEGIELVRKFSTGLPEITADPTQLHQVLVNLIVNAIQAMPDGGKLTIETLSKDGYISLIVEDTGVGMSDEILRQIFNPFFTTKEVGEGTGLGLSVVHGIVSSHGGIIKVDSAVGRGSRFEVQLPVNLPSKEKENS